MATSPIVFFDYDGVLNNPFYLHIARDKEPFEKDFDPKKVQILARICQNLNAVAVATSSWRHNPEAIIYLREHQIPVIAATPMAKDRGREIKAYLKQSYKRTGHRHHYIIIDDETSEYTAEQMNHLIYTRETYANTDRDELIGLQPKHEFIAKAILDFNIERHHRGVI